MFAVVVSILSSERGRVRDLYNWTRARQNLQLKTRVSLQSGSWHWWCQPWGRACNSSSFFLWHRCFVKILNISKKWHVFVWKYHNLTIWIKSNLKGIHYYQTIKCILKVINQLYYSMMLFFFNIIIDFKTKSLFIPYILLKITSKTLIIPTLNGKIFDPNLDFYVMCIFDLYDDVWHHICDCCRTWRP